MEAEEVVCRGRIVLIGVPERLALRTEEGCLPLEYALSSRGFKAGDLVEVRLLERCPDWGAKAWSDASRRG